MDPLSQRANRKDRYELELAYDAWGRLVLIDGAGQRHVGVEPVRAFPLSDPDHWISIVDSDGRELAMVKDLAALSEQTRALLLQELSRREFVPVILRVVRIRGEMPRARWEVETDRGPAEFTVAEEDQVRRLGPNRLLVTDGRGLRYLIPDVTRLDAGSRRLLEPFC
jgi:hypothetical protein